MKCPEPQYSCERNMSRWYDARGIESDGSEGMRWVTTYDLDEVCEYLDLRPSEVRAMNASELATELGHDRGWYSGPGRGFSHGAYASVRRRRVVVVQTSGLDI